MAKRYTQEWRDNISKSRKGCKAWNKGLDKSDYRVKKYTDKLIGREFSLEHRRKLSEIAKNRKPYFLGKHHSEETKRKISRVLRGRINLKTRGKNHYNWKGEKASYKSIHSWTNREFGKIQKCEKCGTNLARRYEWANKSGKYKRIKDDWIRLCTSCHHKYDDSVRKGWITRRLNKKAR